MPSGDVVFPGLVGSLGPAGRVGAVVPSGVVVSLGDVPGVVVPSGLMLSLGDVPGVVVPVPSGAVGSPGCGGLDSVSSEDESSGLDDDPGPVVASGVVVPSGAGAAALPWQRELSGKRSHKIF